MHNEPLGGIYGRTSMATMDIKEQIEVSINGERAALLDLNVRMSETDPKNSLEIKTPPIHIAAGPQRVTAAFIQRFDGPLDGPADAAREHAGRRQHQLRRHRAAAHARHDGARAVGGHRRVRHRQPPDDLHLPADQREGRRNLRRRDREALTARRYRGMATPDDVQDALLFYEQGRKKGDFESGIGWRCKSVLVSPRFLFRLEQAPAETSSVKAARTYRISDQDLASRLSFFLWGTVPDAELIKAAECRPRCGRAGSRSRCGGMLAGSPLRVAVDALRRPVAAAAGSREDSPDYLLFPQYDDTLAQAMQRETELFFDSMVREDRPSWTSDRRLHVRQRSGWRSTTTCRMSPATASAASQTPEYRRGIFGPGQHPAPSPRWPIARRRCSAAMW
jgi:hypothetical protein